jgi:hypothetical protein
MALSCVWLSRMSLAFVSWVSLVLLSWESWVSLILVNWVSFILVSWESLALLLADMDVVELKDVPLMVGPLPADKNDANERFWLLCDKSEE